MPKYNDDILRQIDLNKFYLLKEITILFQLLLH